MIEEKGPWGLFRSKIDPTAINQKTVGISSEDFTHDVILWLSGDFSDEDQKVAYVEEIAKRLNQMQDWANFLAHVAEMAPEPGQVVAMTTSMALGLQAKRLLGETSAEEFTSVVLAQQEEIERLKSELCKRDMPKIFAKLAGSNTGMTVNH